MKYISVCIVDDNPELRTVLSEIITMSDGYLCVGALNTAAEAIQKIPEIGPDVVLMDINLGSGESGIDCVRELKPRMRNTNFMMCTVYEEDDKIFEALSAGASGYILKKTTPTKMLDAIRELHEGGSPMSSQIARKVVAAFQNKPSSSQDSDLQNLSTREREILEWLSKGLTYKEIAAELFISQETVRKHVYHIYEKLHVSNRTEALNKFFGR